MSWLYGYTFLSGGIYNLVAWIFEYFKAAPNYLVCHKSFLMHVNSRSRLPLLFYYKNLEIAQFLNIAKISNKNRNISAFKSNQVKYLVDAKYNLFNDE